jgi:hypothetical protein
MMARRTEFGTSAIIWLIAPARDDDDDDDEEEDGAVGGMIIGKRNLNTRRKSAPVPLCPPQIPHDLTWDRI